ncbi:Glycosyl transferase [Macleaya cordata]|uniref:Glycosyl transferase n=1 Tax=Macleaya cordata TaxID=56857 RepID=A0A200PNU3_MACCD|nr:Glycosyl transferase [Macleaya cordata]
MMVISPSPLSLCCALLLCLPLALVFTSTTTPTAGTTTTNNSDKKKNPLRNFNPPPPPPPPLPEDDESLFRLASRVNPNPSPASSPKKLAFMFLTTTPLPFSPLWELYFNDQNNQTQISKSKLFNIYIHIDPTHPYEPPFTGVFTDRVIHSKPTERFTPSLISAARRLLSHALLHDPSNYMFALLSPTCIPLHSFNFTYKTLIQSKKSFIEILSNEPGAYDRWVARGPEIMLPEVPFENFRVGSQFFVLTRKHARLVVKDERLWSKFKLPCVKWDVCYPEEHYFPTLISTFDRHGCVPATLTHVDWKGRSDGHPRTYEASEVGPELIIKLRRDKPRYGYEINVSDSSVHQSHNDPFLFARKFSPDSLQPLMDIANDVIFRD